MLRLLRRLLAGWVLFRLATAEWMPRFGPGQQAPLRIPGRSVFVGDREMFIREAGDPESPPLLLVHGWGDHSVVVFAKLIPALADHFRVIAVDNRNSGKSDHVRGEYEIGTMADELAGVLDHLGLSNVTVFGYSMGGFISMALAQRHPHLVGKLILSGTAAAPPAVDQPLSLLANAAGIVARAGERISRTEVSWLRTRYLVKVGAVAPEHALWYYTQHRNRDADLYWAAAGAINRFDARDWVGRLGLPTLVLITLDDQLMPSSFQYDLAAKLGGVEVIELTGARHEAPLTHAADYVDAIKAFAL